MGPRAAPGLARAFALIVLAAVAAACQVDVTLETAVEHDGSGRFSLRLALDKELVDLSRSTGEDPLAVLGEFPQELTARGWRVSRSTEGGGQEVVVSRSFTDPEDLNRAIEELQRGLSARGSPTARFFGMTVSRSSSFLRTRTSIEGTIDLTTTGLPLSDESRRTLESLVEQAAGQFFRFTLRTDLAGSVSESTGDPQQVKGGSVTWAPRLGERLAFRASSTAFNRSALLVIGVPALLVLLVIGWLIARRGRRRPS